MWTRARGAHTFSCVFVQCINICTSISASVRSLSTTNNLALTDSGSGCRLTTPSTREKKQEIANSQSQIDKFEIYTEKRFRIREHHWLRHWSTTLTIDLKPTVTYSSSNSCPTVSFLSLFLWFLLFRTRSSHHCFKGSRGTQFGSLTAMHGSVR